MFGYITADSSKLSQKAKNQYKSNYCGLCHTLRERYSPKTRFLLNFDLTFLQIMLIEKSENEHLCVTKKCPYHLGRKKNCLQGEICDYVADVTLLVTCLNFDDDIKDDGSIKAKLLRRIFQKDYLKAKQKRKDLHTKLTGYLEELEKVEKKGITNPDIPSDIFGSFLSELFSYNSDLTEFGFYLGRFIYLYDAVCDFKKDLKKGKYNPLTECRMADFENILISAMQKCLESYQSLGIQSEVIENVLYHGVWLKYGIKYKRKTL